MITNLWKTSRIPCSLAPMYLLRSSGPCREVKVLCHWMYKLLRFRETPFSFIPTVSAKVQLTLMLMKFIPLSLATALASRVFPVPGAPYSKIPERWRIGRLENRMGCCNTPKTHNYKELFGIPMHENTSTLISCIMIECKMLRGEKPDPVWWLILNHYDIIKPRVPWVNCNLDSLVLQHKTVNTHSFLFKILFALFSVSTV